MFDLKNLAFLILIWAVLNILNGIIIFNHDILGTLQSNYYIIVGFVRAMVGIVGLAMCWYIWKSADNIIIFTKKWPPYTTPTPPATPGH